MRLPPKCSSFRCRCIVPSTLSADSISRARSPSKRSSSCTTAILNGASLWPPARSCGSAPPIPRPASRRVSAGSTCAAHFRSPIRLWFRRRHILLVDDILTTGATARAAAQTLLKAGAASVWVATLARAQRAVAFGRSSADANLEESDLEDSRALEDNEALTNAIVHATQSSSSTVGEQPSF